jgi:hypothetical protein
MILLNVRIFQRCLYSVQSHKNESRVVQKFPRRPGIRCRTMFTVMKSLGTSHLLSFRGLHDPPFSMSHLMSNTDHLDARTGRSA